MAGNLQRKVGNGKEIKFLKERESGKGMDTIQSRYQRLFSNLTQQEFTVNNMGS